MQDVGSNVQALLGATPMTSAQADISPAVSAGLTAAGVDPNAARVLGQVANVAAPSLLEAGGARALTEALVQAPGLALSGGLGLADLLSAPEIAYASTSRALDQSGELERLLNEGGQLLGTQGAPMSSIYARASGPDLLAQALGKLQQYPTDQSAAAYQALEDLVNEGHPASTVAARAEQWMQDNPLGAAAREVQAEVQPVAEAVQQATAPPAEQAARTPTEFFPTEEAARAPAPEAAAAATERTPTSAEAARIADEEARAAWSGGAPPPSEPAVAVPPPEGAAPPPVGPPSSGGGTGRVPLVEGSIQAGGGNLFSKLGQRIAAVSSPVTNLEAGARNTLDAYGRLVGRESDFVGTQAREVAARLYAETGVQTSQRGLNLLRSQFASEATHNLIQELRAQGLATSRMSAPASWRAATNAVKGELSNYAFHPDIAGPLQNIVDRSQIAGNPTGARLQQAFGTARSTIFTLSQTHTLTEGLNALFSSPQTFANYARAFASDSFAQGFRGKMAQTFQDAARDGVTQLNKVSSPDVVTEVGDKLMKRLVASVAGGGGGYAAGYTEARVAGKSEDEARAQGIAAGLAGAGLSGLPLPKGVGTVTEALQSALWNRAVPIAKVTAYDALRKGGMDGRLAADVVNERFGGLNYSAMGRDPTAQDALRLIVQAPDWNEATVRQLGSALFGGPGAGASRGFIARTLAGTMLATEALNYATTGHGTWGNQPGHQFEIEAQDPAGGYLHVGILPANLQSYLGLANKVLGGPEAAGATGVSGDVRNFLQGRLSAPLGAALAAGEAAGARNALQQPYGYSKAGPVALGETISPIGIEQVAQGVNEGGVHPLVAAAMALAGLNPRYTNPRAPGGAAPGVAVGGGAGGAVVGGGAAPRGGTAVRGGAAVHK